jgi:predicted PolB exonuclease-like 3'-5' exonuclease
MARGHEGCASVVVPFRPHPRPLPAGEGAQAREKVGVTMSFAIFDIETRIDKALIRAVMYPHEDVTDEEAYRRFRQRLVEEREGRSDFMPVAFHIPITIVVGNVASNRILTSVEALCEENYSEEGIVREFWRRVELFPGTLVTFNGRNFDLPVLELQALRYGCQAPRYFNEKYGHRYRYSEERHYDLLDFLTNAGVHRLRGGFHLLTKLIGLPGKTSINGAEVQRLWEDGQLARIQAYCRQDVIQTYGLFLRVELMRGRLTPQAYQAALEAAAPFLHELHAPLETTADPDANAMVPPLNGVDGDGHAHDAAS